MSGGGYTRKQEECEQASNDAAAARREYDAHRQDAGRVREDLETAQREAESAKIPVERKRHDIAQAEARLKVLTREGGPKQSGFPDKMPTLLKAIQQEQSFTTRPVGPVGHHVTLLKPKWASILENSFGGTLGSFIVTSKRDMNTLSQIMRRVNW